MEDLRIPFVLWLSGEEPPNLGAMTAPVAFAVSFRADSGTMQQNALNTDGRAVVATDGEANE
jgi:hypothetical protein